MYMSHHRARVHRLPEHPPPPSLSGMGAQCCPPITVRGRTCAPAAFRCLRPASVPTYVWCLHEVPFLTVGWNRRLVCKDAQLISPGGDWTHFFLPK